MAPPREIARRPWVAPVTRSGDIVLRAENLSKAYDKRLFANLDLQITRGEPLGILGPNGSGKTTCALSAGTARAGHGACQSGTGSDGRLFRSAPEHVGRRHAGDGRHPAGPERLCNMCCRDLLARFGVVGDTAPEAGGHSERRQRCRAALARLAAADANFLVLDEPTNHLDLWARDALERALGQFDGTVLFVSHDRYFVNQVADHLLVVEPDRFRVVEGNYETYLHMLESAAERAVLPAKSRRRRSLRGPRRRSPPSPRSGGFVSERSTIWSGRSLPRVARRGDPAIAGRSRRARDGDRFARQGRNRPAERDSANALRALGRGRS